MRANEVNPDPNTAVVVCTASLLGLVARDTTGRGQQIFVDMFGANAYANFDNLLDYPGKPERPSLGPELAGPGPLQRLYRAQDGWVYLGIHTPQEWERFAALVGFDSPLDPFAASTDPAALAEALAGLFRGQDADAWEARLAPEGIGCVRADRVNTGEFFRDAGFEDSPWMARVSHADFGDYYRHKPMVEFSTPNTALEAGVRAGEHGAALLEELGYDAGTIEGLFESGVLFSVDRPG
jgi:crotonobetainyl-CoA:carnitine CoA-transferase CaiB-like acyl-CoA transferase